MVRGVGVLCQKLDGRRADMRVCRGCIVVETSYCRFSGISTYFAISMPSCGCCDCDTYDNSIMVRGVGVLCQKFDGSRADMMVCGGCLVVETS